MNGSDSSTTCSGSSMRDAVVVPDHGRAGLPVGLEGEVPVAPGEGGIGQALPQLLGRGADVGGVDERVAWGVDIGGSSSARLEVGQGFGPAAVVVADPPIGDLVDRGGVEVVQLLPAVAHGGHQAGDLEDRPGACSPTGGPCPARRRARAGSGRCGPGGCRAACAGWGRPGPGRRRRGRGRVRASTPPADLELARDRAWPGRPRGRDFSPSRKYAHLVEQWAWNGTGSRQPALVNRTTVSPSAWSSSKVKVVSSHSSGPSTQRHTTRSGVTCSTAMVTTGSGRPKQNGHLAAFAGVAFDVTGPPGAEAVEGGQGVVHLGLGCVDADAVPDVGHGLLQSVRGLGRRLRGESCSRLAAFMMRSQLAACQPRIRTADPG